jgi:hypothetical protein
MGALDALGWQNERAKPITEPGADAGLALKATQPTRPGEGQRFVEDVKAARLAPLTAARHTPPDAAPGRLATRHAWSTSDSEGCPVRRSVARQRYGTTGAWQRRSLGASMAASVRPLVACARAMGHKLWRPDVIGR